MKEIFQKIKKRDLLYILGFMAYNLFILLIWKVSSVELLINQLSFAASLLSIILACFAIIYAWYQTTETKVQHRMIRKTFQKVNQKLEEINQIESQVIRRVSDNSKLGEGMRLISKGLQQLKKQRLSKSAVRQIEVLEQKNQDLMNQVVGLSDLSMVYHTEEINLISDVLNQYSLGDWFELKDVVEKIQAKSPHTDTRDIQNMVLFYLAHLNLLGYIRSKNNRYTRIKEIPLIKRKD